MPDQHSDISDIREQLADLRLRHIEGLGEIRQILTKHEAVIDSVIAEKRESAEFWAHMRKTLADNGLRGLFVCVGWLAYYVYRQYLTPHG